MHPFGRLALTTLVASLVSPGAAWAVPCTSTTGSVTPALKRQLEIERSVNAAHEKDGSDRSKIYFVLPSETGKNSKIFPFSLRPDGSVAELPGEMAAKLSAAKEVQIHNPSAPSPLYFLPATSAGAAPIDVKAECPKAYRNGRRAGRGCSVLTMDAPNFQTVLYSKSAQRCDEIAQAEDTASQSYQTSVEILNGHLGIDTNGNAKVSTNASKRTTSPASTQRPAPGSAGPTQKSRSGN